MADNLAGNWSLGAPMRMATEGAAMTWLEVLWSLTTLEESARGWFPVAIEASRPRRGEPRYRLMLQHMSIRREAGSYAAFEQIVAAG